MGLEDIGCRAVIENLGGYLSGMAAMQKATDAESKSLESLGDISKKARADLDRIINGSEGVTSSLGNLTGVQEMANRGFAGMQGPIRSSTDALESMGRGLDDDGRELLGMTNALNSTKTGWQKFKESMDSAMSSVREHKLLIGAFGAAIVGSLGLMVREAEAQRLSIAKLSLALENVGVSYAGVRKELEATMEATARKTGISDEAQREALSKLVFITGSYEKSLAALPVVLDLAAFAGMDAASAAMILGRAMAGSTAMLSRYGIYVREGANATEILASVQRKVAGSAEAMASPFTIIKDQMGELGETIGTILLPPLKLFNTVAVGIIDVIKWLVENTGFLGKAVVYLTGVVGIGALALVAYSMAVGNAALKEAWGLGVKVAHAVAQGVLNLAVAAGIAPATGFAVAINLAIWPLTLIVGIIAAVVAGIIALIKNWNKVMSIFGLGKKTVKETSDSVEGLNKELADLTTEQADQKVALENTQEELKILQSEYTHVQENSAGYRNEIRRLDDAIDAHKTKIDALNVKIDATKNKMKALEDSTAAAYDELNRLANPRIEGMQKYEDQIFGIEQQLKKLRLTELQTGPTAKTTAEIEKLEKQLSILQLQSEITFDPLVRGAKEAVEDITGANDFWAMASFTGQPGEAPTFPSFIENQARIIAENAKAQKELSTELGGYTTELTSETLAMNALQDSLDSIMTIVNGQLETMADNILVVKNRLYDLEVQARATQAAYDAANAAVIAQPEAATTEAGTAPSVADLFPENPDELMDTLLGAGIPINVEVPPVTVVTPVEPTKSQWDDIWKNLMGIMGGTISTAAYGGYFGQAQPVMVGERGPEVVMMPSGSTVQPNQYNTSYNVNANYPNAQSPASIALDLEAIRMYSRV